MFINSTNERSNKMINRNEITKREQDAVRKMEAARQQMQRVKRDKAVKKRKLENHYKYIAGGIVMKYLPDMCDYDELELNRIIGAAMKSEQCRSITELVRRESSENEVPETAHDECEEPDIEEDESYESA
jgi:hypothetical protein